MLPRRDASTAPCTVLSVLTESARTPRYRLGPLDRTQHVVVDVALAPEWEAALMGLPRDCTQVTAVSTDDCEVEHL